MKPNCSQIDRLKEAYVDGTLPAEATAAIQEHAATCSACTARLETASKVEAGMRGAVKSLLGRPVLPASKAAGLYARITRTAASPFVKAGRSALPAPALMLAAMAVITLLVTQLGLLNAFNEKHEPDNR